MRSIGEASENIGGEITEVQYKILQCLKEKTTLSARGLSEIIGITSRNIEENIKKLKANGKLRRHGSPKNGHWEVVGE